MTDQMYKPMPRSPMTTLYQGIDASQTTITVADASKLPDAPNKATIGGGDDSETVMYTGKSGNDLTGCTRGFDPSGSAKAWDSGTPVARVWTSQDLEVVQDNLDALDGHDNTLHSEDYVPASEKGANNGIATLDSGGDVPATQLGNVDAGGMEVHDNTYHSPNYATESNLNDHVGATGNAHGTVTTSVNGFMGSTDKTKLNGIDSNANNYSHPSTVQCNVQSTLLDGYEIQVNGNDGSGIINFKT